jgi:hypothetical protein
MIAGGLSRPGGHTSRVPPTAAWAKLDHAIAHDGDRPRRGGEKPSPATVICTEAAYAFGDLEGGRSGLPRQAW